MMEKMEISKLSSIEKKRSMKQRKTIKKCGKKSNHLLKNENLNSILQRVSGKFQVMSYRENCMRRRITGGYVAR